MYNASGKHIGEIKSIGGYILAAGSIHPDGPTYTVIDDSNVANAPVELVDELVKNAPTKSSVDASVNGPKIPRGQHDTELHRIAGKLRHLELEEEAIYTALVEICQKRCENFGTDYLEMCRKHAHNICKHAVPTELTFTIGGKLPEDTVAAKPSAPSYISSDAKPAEAESAEDNIPDFDRSVITGFFKKVVDLVCQGTTIPPQFAYLAAKVFVGARMAGKVTFENLDADSSYYGAAIAETGTGKGLAWRRTAEGVFQTANMLDSGVKLIYSADSGAGLKDVFFETPEEQQVICYVDEVTTLGHKSGEKKNPEILDTIIELADSNRISRVLASRKGQKANRTTNNARLSLYVCGQNGEVFMSSFAGRTKLGLYDRLYAEYSPAVEAGDLPEVDHEKSMKLLIELNNMKMSGHMTMSPEAKQALEDFWKAQTPEVRKKPRFKKHLMLDMYLGAFLNLLWSRQARGSSAKLRDPWHKTGTPQ
jgi:hypothetical protein